MENLRVFCDLAMDEAALAVLKRGIAPHEVLRPAKPAPSVLGKSGDDPLLAEADIAFGQPDAAAVLRAPRLQWVHLSSAGYTRFDTLEFRSGARAKRLTLTNSSSVYAAPCAEHALAFMLAQARLLPQGLASRCRSGSPDWLQIRAGSRLLSRQHVLLLGFGAIGRQLHRLLAPFEARVTAFRRQQRGDEDIEIVTESGLAEALGSAHHVVNLLPDNPATRGLVSNSRIAAMKAGAVFYNIGRGTTVDQEALATALNAGHLAAAWLDVTDPEPLPQGHPLLQARNCHITPHTAGGHEDEAGSLVRHFIGNFGKFQRGEELNDKVW